MKSMNINSGKIFDLLLNYLQIPINELNEQINKAPYSYKQFEIKKKNGGSRIVWQPSLETKILQEILYLCIFQKFPININCFSYRRGLSSPLFLNAKKHCSFDYTLHLDFKHFFESINSQYVFNMLERFDEHKYPNFSAQDKKVIEKVCFIKKNKSNCLVVGAPSSPIISNIFMLFFDNYFSKLSNANNDSYTRYADDIWFSSDNLENIHDYKINVNNFCATDPYYNNLQLNYKKTKISKLKSGISLTGVSITNLSEIKVSKKIKQKTKKLIYELNTKNFTEDEKSKLYHQLRGYIAYIKDIEPSYINSLILKYGPMYSKALNYF